jgi:hypothetical protein
LTKYTRASEQFQGQVYSGLAFSLFMLAQNGISDCVFRLCKSVLEKNGVSDQNIIEESFDFAVRILSSRLKSDLKPTNYDPKLQVLIGKLEKTKILKQQSKMIHFLMKMGQKEPEKTIKFNRKLDKKPIENPIPNKQEIQEKTTLKDLKFYYSPDSKCPYSETELVRDLIFTFQGIDSSLIEWCPKTNVYKMDTVRNILMRHYFPIQ